QIAETDSITPKESAALLVNTGSDGRLNHIAYRYAPLIMLIFSPGLIIFAVCSHKKSDKKKTE
ncbi:MAG: hypothetical protein PHP68_00605, partial [Oscillospiraceae bacterium]|nr:hypothetical protein [Oscillospiraceae bacterium]